ncbi:phosphodiester glycosidase family protein [Solirubrobacter sp. CPCC 204708]|uniref:Phosphodiester glycosidase family protein n=1 Tax=Solirubrobacter deserti TaxID=2282478 RepID=A0ABT4RQW0_9ACTN|nr:phosphodiester glycosidase family protein [Solirubrobacter deserti]MBE2320098.1 phosphodiester glycosidase family protein [Solirubrobacter deserti]MDA0140963.1 phosphodiester glycosidase family protein [Solirubrobacter deserti]
MALATKAPLSAPRAGSARSMRLDLADGACTTIHVAVHDREHTELRVALMRGQAKLEAWCAAQGIQEAIVGGFFARPHGTPLGEVRTRGVAREHVPFTAPFDAVRACVHVDGGEAAIAPRSALPAAPRGDLLQAGPLLVRDGAPIFRREDDVEGFSAANGQFDSDITDGRYPRAALGLCADRIFAVAVDGRSADDSGLTLEELAALMAALGADVAMNLDGGGSTSLVSGGRLQNRPRSQFDVPEPGGRPVSTALVFLPR